VKFGTVSGAFKCHYITNLRPFHVRSHNEIISRKRLEGAMSFAAGKCKCRVLIPVTKWAVALINCGP
jgi:hypothetical protein